MSDVRAAVELLEAFVAGAKTREQTDASWRYVNFVKDAAEDLAWLFEIAPHDAAMTIVYDAGMRRPEWCGATSEQSVADGFRQTRSAAIARFR